MDWNKMTLAAIFSLFILLGGRDTSAQTPLWGKVTSAANAASQQGEYAVAQALYTEAIEIQEKTLGADNPGVAISLNNLAVFYQDQSMYSQAEQTYRQALGILEKDPRREASTALTLNNLAALYHDEDMDAKAEPLYTRALGIWETLGKKDSANEAVTAAGLAGIYHSRNQDTDAKPLYTRALRLWNELGKSESAEAAAALFRMGEIYRFQSNIEDAGPMYAHALSIWESAAEMKSPEVIAAQAALGEIYRGKVRGSGTFACAGVESHGRETGTGSSQCCRQPE
jgi:tetratricopeptide (TPR) repeat protein